MKRTVRKRLGVSVIILLAVVLLILFRFDLIFRFQQMRLHQLDCVDRVEDRGTKTTEAFVGCGKLWVHRADSYARFTRLSPYFAGLEVDLVFDKTIKSFRVYHPPVDPGTLLADTLFSFNVIAGKKIWLDIKNIQSGEFGEAITYFQHCDSLYKIKENIIIESEKMEFVNRLAAAGFTVSYMASSRKLDENDPQLSVDAASLSPLVKYVSQEDIYVARLKKFFPQKKIITWAIAFGNYYHLNHFNELLKDTAVSVVLINVKSRDYR